MSSDVQAAELAEFLVAQQSGTAEALPQLAAKALRAIRLHLGMEVAFVSQFDAGRRVFRHVDAESEMAPVQVGAGDPLEESYCQRVVDGRLPELIHDACAMPAALELAATAALPVGAHLSVPIRLDNGYVYGTFCCFSSTPDHSLNDRDVAVMRIFADLIAEEIDKELEADRRRQEVVNRISSVVAGSGLSMVYQPIVDVRSNRPLGYEALARFPGGRTRGPDVWFREAAEVGMAVELEVAAVRAALEVMPRLPTDAYLAVNVSPAVGVSGELARLLAPVAVDRLVLEITEHEATTAYDELLAALSPLRRRGMRLAIDDAGAGYASFRHILRLQPDVIKIDMTITRDIDDDPARRALATALIAFARDTNSLIVAEGVETDAELHTLQALGITAAQGYHLGRPGPIAARCRSLGTARTASVRPR